MRGGSVSRVVFVSLGCLYLSACHNFSLSRVPQAPTESEVIESYVARKRNAPQNPTGVFKSADGQFHTVFYADADAYCRNIMFYGQRTYRRFAWVGGITAILGAAGTGAATAWAATDDSEDHKGLGGKVGLAAGTAVLTAGGLFMIKRAIAAAQASGAAGKALGPDYDAEDQACDTEACKRMEKDCRDNPDSDECLKGTAKRKRQLEKKRWQACVDTRSAWLGGNSDALLALSGSKAEAAEKKDESADDSTKKVEKPETFDAWVKTKCPADPKLPTCYICKGLADVPKDYLAYVGSEKLLEEIQDSGHTFCPK